MELLTGCRIERYTFTIIPEVRPMLYPIHTNSKPAVGKTGKKIALAAITGKPICNKAACATIASIANACKAKNSDAAKTKVR